MDQPEEDWKTEPWSIPKVATGIEGLDEILHGGLPAGRMIIAAGGPGTAKTVFASEFVYRGAMAGSPGIFVSFEEEEAALRANARTFGWDFEKLEDAGRLRLMAVELPRGIVRAGEFDIQGLLTILSARVKALKADRIVLDAVDVFLNVYNEMDREREALGQLQDWLRRQDVTAVFTLKTLPEGKRLYPFLDFMADCVIYFDQRISDQVRTRRLSVVKYRGSGYMGNEHPFLVSRTGIRLLPVPAVTMSHRPLGEYISSGSTKFD